MGRIKTVQVSTGTSAGTVTGIDGTATAKSADYTVTDTDRIRTVLMTTGASNRTVTLPTAADNAHRIITVMKVDSGAGLCTVDGEGSEAIYGGSASATTFVLYHLYDRVTLMCDGTGWHVIAVKGTTTWRTFTPSISNQPSTSVNAGKYRRVGDTMEIEGAFTVNGPGSGGTMALTIPDSFNVNTSSISTTAGGITALGHGSWFDAGIPAQLHLTVGYASGTTVNFIYNSTSVSDTLDGADMASSDQVSYHVTVPITEFAHFGGRSATSS